MQRRLAFLLALSVLVPMSWLVPATAAAAKKPEREAAEPEAEKELMAADTFRGLALRGIGPALTSGRIADLAVDPENRKIYYVAVASGGVWKTVNAGTTWTPVFDDQGSYSIGCVTLDPSDSNVVWVGTGENNSQRSVGYGDGVYKSVDGGKSWKNMGLAESEHIGKIVVDPRDSDVVYVAAQGPLWRAGDDRGLYKTTDGGVTWERVLEVDEHTGVSDLVFDPRDPDVLYASSYQRRRRVWTLIDGGPGSAIHKSTDAGVHWSKLDNGLPEEDMGRIGLAISPADPDVVYAIIEAARDAGGFFRSVDRGATWEKRSDYVSGSPQYYNEIIPDPRDVDRVYSMDTWMMVTDDGGASFQQVPETAKHVDSHALWIDPDDTDYLLAGCDGGVYESFDRAATWDFKANLPVTQFYKGTVDNDFPFYNVYGGTQDNFTLGGPSRTKNHQGITNREWYVTLGGDGFAPRVDPENPDVVYSQSQNGGLNRIDRKSGEMLPIRPQPAPGEDPPRWNWDSPLIISPHSHTRLYYAAQRVYRSDDRGDGWRPISPDLTRQLDRNTLEVMGRVWSVDAVAKNRSTSYYGNVVSLSESPRVEGLLYAGTDDGLIQVLEPGAESWRKIRSTQADEGALRELPELSYVDHVEASRHDDDTVYAAFNDHKSGNFAPYVLKSTDRGVTWTSITGVPDHGALPERGSVYSLAEDHEDPDLLFAGTEFGVFFTVDGGGRWIALAGGMPVIAVRDLAIQRRENDLLAVTFGRGFYILDDYTPLRHVDAATLEQEAKLFPVKDTWMYMEAFPLGLRDKSFQGDGFYTAPNPPYGAVFTYYLKDAVETRAEARHKREEEIREAGGDNPYPSWDELRAEDREAAAAIVLTVRDGAGDVVRRLTGPTAEGFHRVAWDLRYPPPDPASLTPFEPPNPFVDPQRGPMVVPGTYSVSIAKSVDSVVSPLSEPQSFTTEPLGVATLAAADKAEMLAFQKQTAELQRAVLGTVAVAGETQTRLEHVLVALADTPAAGPELSDRARGLLDRLRDLREELEGDQVIREHSEPTPPSITARVGAVLGGWTSSSAPTRTHRDNYDYAEAAFSGLLEKLRTLIADLEQLEDEMEALGAPWTPGRVPQWQ
ncbi:MAG: glycosyl hydrolase [Thermoanaerobaculia bacterium]